jgi:hypothetical protein
VKLNLPPEVVEAHLEEYRERFERGDKAALFSVIRFCFNEQIVAPEWIVDAFFKATNKWYSLKAKTLDEAFNVRWPKGKSIAAAKKRQRLKFAVLSAVRAARNAGRPVDEELFEKIGRELGIGKTLAKDYLKAARLAMTPSAIDMLLEPLVVNKGQGRGK